MLYCSSYYKQKFFYTRGICHILVKQFCFKGGIFFFFCWIARINCTSQQNLQISIGKGYVLEENTCITCILKWWKFYVRPRIFSFIFHSWQCMVIKMDPATDVSTPNPLPRKPSQTAPTGVCWESVSSTCQI